ncbi:41407_t:CDS:1, partial [Gigaspora margarita]
ALTIKVNSRNEVIHDEDIQEFLGLDFRVKVETTDEETCSRMIFYDKKEEKKIPIPDGIICKSISSDKRKKKKNPVGDFFIITYPHKYIVYYNLEKKKTNKLTKIYMINCEIKKKLSNS